MYSQNLEEQYILEHFDKMLRGATPPRWIIHGNSRPTFIDIGANDGITFSNTRALAELGSEGIFVEPSPKAFVKLRENCHGMPGLYFYNVALSDFNGKKILNQSSSIINSGDIGLVSTFEESEMQRFKSICKYEQVTVKVQKWKTFLNMKKIKEFDFVSLDIEGHELKVLPDMDLSKTSLIAIEHNGKENLKKDYLYYTSKYGLSRIIYESGENILIAR